jgi:hypothetical protein
MKLNKSDFNSFVQQKSGKYPYCEVRITRRHFHVKWLVLAQSGTSFVSLPSRVLSKETVTSLIIGKEALPVPFVLNEIMDFMERWGRGEDNVWYRQVVDWVGFVCNEGIKQDYLGIAYDCIALRVRRVLYLHGMDGNRRIFTAWKTFFFHQYEYVTSDFVLLKQASMNFIAGMIHTEIPGTAATVGSNLSVVSP